MGLRGGGGEAEGLRGGAHNEERQEALYFRAFDLYTFHCRSPVTG